MRIAFVMITIAVLGWVMITGQSDVTECDALSRPTALSDCH